LGGSNLIDDYQGEIDILEGVNDQEPNQVTLHTNSGEKPQYYIYHGTLTDALTIMRLHNAIKPFSEWVRKIRGRVQVV
jgi:hypothetical protein